MKFLMLGIMLVSACAADANKSQTNNAGVESPDNSVKSTIFTTDVKFLYTNAQAEQDYKNMIAEHCKNSGLRSSDIDIQKVRWSSDPADYVLHGAEAIASGFFVSPTQHKNISMGVNVVEFNTEQGKGSATIILGSRLQANHIELSATLRSATCPGA